MRGRFHQAPLPAAARQAIASLAATRRPPFTRDRRGCAGRSMQADGPRGARAGYCAAGRGRRGAAVHSRRDWRGVDGAVCTAAAAKMQGLPGPQAARACPPAGAAHGSESSRMRGPAKALCKRNKGRAASMVCGMHAGRAGKECGKHAGSGRRRRNIRRPAVARILGCRGGSSAAGPDAAGRRQNAAAPDRRRGRAQEKPAGGGAPRLHGMQPGGRSRGGRSAKRPSPRGGAEARARREEAALGISHSPAAAGKRSGPYGGPGHAAGRPRSPCGGDSRSGRGRPARGAPPHCPRHAQCRKCARPSPRGRRLCGNARSLCSRLAPACCNLVALRGPRRPRLAAWEL